MIAWVADKAWLSGRVIGYGLVPVGYLQIAAIHSFVQLVLILLLCFQIKIFSSVFSTAAFVFIYIIIILLYYLLIIFMTFCIVLIVTFFTLVWSFTNLESSFAYCFFIDCVLFRCTAVFFTFFHKPFLILCWFLCLLTPPAMFPFFNSFITDIRW